MSLKVSMAMYALCFSGFVISSPLVVEGKQRGFSVVQVARGPRVMDGPSEMLRMYYKYKSVPPKDLLLAANASSAAAESTGAAPTGTQTGSTPNNPRINDISYLCPVTIGTTGQTFNMTFDTASADLWVFSTELPFAEQAGHTLYNPSSSSTSQQLQGYSWQLRYEDGSSASGNVCTDKVIIGGVTATRQAVEAAETASAQLQRNPSDGIVGLAMSNLNRVQPQAQSTFFDTIKSSLALPLFTATLKHQAPGSYDFGYIDNSKYTGNIAYAPVIANSGVWEFESTGFAVGSSPTYSYNVIVVADTGTSLSYLDEDIVNYYYSQVEGAEYDRNLAAITFSCAVQLPDFTAIVGGQPRTMPGSYVNFAPLSNGRCLGGIQYNTGLPVSILGDVFLKSQFVVFDSNGPQIGFAQQA